MATVAHALTTKAKVKLQLQIPDATTTHDNFIDATIAYLTDWFEQACGGRRFKRTTYTNDIYDCNGGKRVYFKQWPASSVSAVEYNSGSYSTPNWVAFDANSYTVNLAAGYIEFVSELPVYAQYVRLTYAAGYLIDFTDEYNTAVHTLPFDIAGLITDLAVKAFNMRNASGVKQESTEGQSITYSDKLADEHVAVIAKYAEQSFG